MRLLAVTATIDRRQAARESLLRHAVLIWLVGTLVLMPVDAGGLPFNIGLADLWILMALPFVWLYFMLGSWTIVLSYIVPMWFILVSGLASTFVALEASSSLVVISKEIFLFVWFATLTAVFSRLDAKDLRLVMSVWLAVVVLHGALVVAQFLFPGIWRITSALAGRSTAFATYRPGGLFENANRAAFYQLVGYVPLLLVRPTKRLAIVLGIFLLLTVLATGSMGTAVAFALGLAVAVIAASWGGKLLLPIKMLAQLAIIVSLLGGLLYFVVGQNGRVQEHLSHILLGRVDRSSGGRFDLWQRGLEVFRDHDVLVWGIGPENFRFVDEQGKQLHNDLLAFTVERGLLGTVGLVAFAILAVSKAVQIVLIQHKHPDRAGLVVVVFLAAMVAAVVESLTHQTFHYRELWLVLALQEAALSRMTAVASQVPDSPAGQPAGHRQGFAVYPDVAGGRF
jgi:O-antigen ligase